jgi:hypothetical protein
MINLEQLRKDYTQMPIGYLQKIANEDYAIDKKLIKSYDNKSLIDNMIAIEFKNYYK